MAVAALEVGGVKLADKASVGGQELVLNGAGDAHAWSIFKVYVGEPVRAAGAKDTRGRAREGAAADPA